MLRWHAEYPDGEQLEAYREGRRWKTKVCALFHVACIGAKLVA